MKLLVVTPTRREARAIAVVRHPALCGAGSEAGARVSRRIAHDRPDLVVIAGFCGGLDPSLNAGDIVLGRQVGNEAKSLIEPDRFLLDAVRHRLGEAGLRFVYSRLLTLDRPAATVKEKTMLWNEHGAGGVDMETWHIAEAAHKAAVPWLALRAVVDTSGQALPAALRLWNPSTPEAKIVRQALARPHEWPRYLALGRHAGAAGRALAQALGPAIAAAEATSLFELPMVEARP